MAQLVVFSTKHSETRYLIVATLGGVAIAVRNLGVISDQVLSFDSHIKQVSAFFHLRNIVKIRNILSQGF